MPIVPSKRRLAEPPLGTRFGRLTVTGPEHNRNGIRCVPCRCECGSDLAPQIQNLLKGRSTSCGCARQENRRKTHGETGTPLYWVWHAMLGRCRTPGNKHFHNYGGRGIAVCPEWVRYEGFRDWAAVTGYADGLEIDRKDNDGPYAPDNCHWVTHIANTRNQRRTRMVEAFGETKALAAWAEDPHCVVPKPTFVNRLNRGVPPEKALTLPSGQG